MADPPSAHQPAPTTRSPATAWAAYAVCALALLSAVPSFYWALGGTAGLDTVGGAIEELGRTRDPAGVGLGIGAGVLKVAGGLLALALVRPVGPCDPPPAAAWYRLGRQGAADRLGIRPPGSVLRRGEHPAWTRPFGVRGYVQNFWPPA
jgi:Protein of unknown function (DUF3995)